MQINDYSSTKLVFAPLYHVTPTFYQIAEKERDQEILTRADLNKTLAEKKIEYLTSSDMYSVKKLSYVLLVLGIGICFLENVVAFFKGNDYYNQKSEVCSEVFYLNNTEKNQIEPANLFYPCSNQQDNGWWQPWNAKLRPISTISITICTALFATFLTIAYDKYKIYSQKLEVDRFYDTREGRTLKLSYVLDLKEEVQGFDVRLIFPYLEDTQLALLTFSTLKKVKDVWEELFQQKLDASLFSVQQLKIWRLFKHFLESNEPTRLRILNSPNYQEIIGSEPLFFQDIVLTSKLLGREDRKVKPLCEILKHKILTAEAASCFNEDDLISTVLDVSEDKVLEKVVDFHLNQKDIQNHEEEGLSSFEKAFNTFLKTGKLIINKPSDYYEFLKLALEKEHAEIANWLQAYVKDQLPKILEGMDLSAFIHELDELNLSGLKIKVDEYLANGFKNSENTPSFCSDSFKSKYLFATKHELLFYKAKLRDHFKESIKTFEFTVTAIVGQMNNILDAINGVFGKDPARMISRLEEKFTEFLQNYPECIEKIADEAKAQNNTWVMKLILSAYRQNPETFSSHWLSPYEDTILEEVTSL